MDIADSAPTGAVSVLDNGEPSVRARLDGRDARSPTSSEIVPASLREPSTVQIQAPIAVAESSGTTIPSAPSSGTVVLDVEQGGIVVPSFVGKSVRSAIELAETSGLDLDIVGSGLAQDQSPAAGAHVPSGARITVKFGR